MLVVFVSVFSVMVITMIIMAVGVMFGREPIKGSCGGLGAVGVERACGCVDVCKNEAVTSPNSTSSASQSDVSKSTVKIYHPS